MLVADNFFSWDARENKAIAHLCTALDDVVATGRPSSVDCFPGSLTNREFVAIAVDLCNRAELNIAVLANQASNALTLVPLLTTAAAPRRPLERNKPIRALAGVGAPADIFV
jgi:hypothetical protein